MCVIKFSSVKLIKNPLLSKSRKVEPSLHLITVGGATILYARHSRHNRHHSLARAGVDYLVRLYAR